MTAVSINLPAPDFTIEDYRGEEFSLKDYRGEKYVLLVFNRGFM